MVDLPSDRLTYPARTGRQSDDGPPAPTPDPALLAILDHSVGMTTRQVALAIQAAGYRRPQPVDKWEALVDFPPLTMLNDGRGRPWSADGIPHELWEKCGPWTVIYTPPITDVVNG